MNDWFSKKHCATELKKHHPKTEITDLALHYEKGAQEFVTHQWNTLLKNIEIDFPFLVPVIQAAYNSKTLKVLYPFTSHDKLCFSRCTGYPYTDDCPYIVPLYGAKGVYQVYDPKGILLGEGGSLEVVDIAVKNLPRNCSSAVHGTAENTNIAQTKG